MFEHPKYDACELLLIAIGDMSGEEGKTVFLIGVETSNGPSIDPGVLSLDELFSALLVKDLISTLWTSCNNVLVRTLTLTLSRSS